MTGSVEVRLWGTTVGYLGYPPGEKSYAVFEYDPDFMSSGIQISPIHLSYPPGRFRFENLNYNSFHGLPGIMADSLPDSFGNRLIDIYMAGKGRPSLEVTPLDRLNYVAGRSMGALEYRPGESLPLQRTALDLNHLAELAEMVQMRKDALQEQLVSAVDRSTALSMIRIGSSAGGARSKALVALSPTGILLDGTVNHGPGYSYWVLKFDSSSNRDRDNADPRGMPVLEYIYSIIARKAGISMPGTRLIDDGRDRHFMIERFDRIIREGKEGGKLDKLHYASWAGLAHADRDDINSYEQLVLFVRQMGLGQNTETEIFRRAVFNIIGRNQDDHTKNTGFLMDRSGKWRLSPAFDLSYAYDPYGRWTRNHQCWLNGKNSDFELQDLISFGRACNLDEKKSLSIIAELGEAFSEFSSLAREHELPEELRKTVDASIRWSLISGLRG